MLKQKYNKATNQGINPKGCKEEKQSFYIPYIKSSHNIRHIVFLFFSKSQTHWDIVSFVLNNIQPFVYTNKINTIQLIQEPDLNKKITINYKILFIN